MQKEKQTKKNLKEKISLVGIMPAYNEEENIRQTTIEWYKALSECDKNAKLLVLNDGSKDNTLEILKEIHKEYPNIVICNKKNSGHGRTLYYGYKKALELNPKWVFQTDSDGQTNPNEFKEFWSNRFDYDVILGHRKGRQDGGSRIVVTNVLKILLFLFFRIWIKDANVPFRLMKKDILKKALYYISKEDTLPNIYLSVIFCNPKNYIKTKFIDITFKPRQGGVNSINLKRIFKIGYDSLFNFMKFKKKIKNSNLFYED